MSQMALSPRPTIEALLAFHPTFHGPWEFLWDDLDRLRPESGWDATQRRGRSWEAFYMFACCGLVVEVPTLLLICCFVCSPSNVEQEDDDVYNLKGDMLNLEYMYIHICICVASVLFDTLCRGYPFYLLLYTRDTNRKPHTCFDTYPLVV